MLRSSVFTFILVSQSLYASIELDYLNSLRTSTGLAPFTQQANLDTAAQNHSIYMQTNNVFGHYEDSANSGFTGTFASGRVIASGYANRQVAENVSYGSNATGFSSLDGLFSAIYHRFGFLSMNYDEVGIGISTNEQFYTYNMGNDVLNTLCQGPSYTGSGGYTGICADITKRISISAYEATLNDIKASSPKLIMFPAQNSNDIPPVFNEESPDPLSGHSVTGNPVSVEFNDAKFSAPPIVNSFILEDSAGTVQTDIIVMDATNDPNNKFSTYQVALFPEKRLEWGSQYDVELIYTDNGNQVTKNWCFATRSLISKSNNFYKVENNANISLNVKAGEPYAIYIVPNDTNDILNGVGYSYNSDAPVFSILDSNTILVTLTGSSGTQANFNFGNGQKIHLTIANTDTATTPLNEECTVPNMEPVDNDFNGDGIADILWRSGSTNHLWQVQADGTHNYINIGSKSSTYTIAGLADFNADGITDILWRKGHQNYIWYMQADGTHTYKKIASKSYTPVAVKDFNSDGIADILWRKDNNNHIWYMNTDGTHTYKNIGTKASVYTIAGTGDLNGDGTADILWRKGYKNYIWYMNEDGTHTYKKITSKSYNVMAVEDFNGDGTADILWRLDDKNNLWYMNADGTYTYKSIGTKSATYVLTKVADYNGDGITDILWKKGSSNYLWYMHADGSHTYKKISGKNTSYGVQ